MSWWLISIVFLVGLILAGGLGTAIHGFMEGSGSFRSRFRCAWRAVVETAQWPVTHFQDRKAKQIDAAVSAAIVLKLATLTDTELITIARRDMDRFERCLRAAQKMDSFAEAFRPVGQAFGQIMQMFASMGEGISQGIKDAGYDPANITPREARIVAEIMRSEQVGEHNQQKHRISVATDRVWTNFIPKDCRRCKWLANPGADPEDREDARIEASEQFGDDTCTCGADETIQFPPHESFCPKWTVSTGNPV